MGLDAVVFLGDQRLRQKFPGVSFRADAETGCPIPTDESIELPLSSLTAAQYEVGNIAAAGELRALVGRVLKPDSVVLTRILYSGSHSGDSIPPDLFPQLAEELQTLRSSSDARIQGFASNMQELLVAALAERNPIAFC